MRQLKFKIEPDPKKIVTEFLRSGRRLEEFDRFYTKCMEEPILKLRKPKPNQYQGIVSLPANPLMVLQYEPVKLNNDFSICQSSDDFGTVMLETYK